MEKLNKGEEIHLQENSVDTQIAKLIAVKDYTLRQNQEFHKQIQQIR